MAEPAVFEHAASAAADADARDQRQDDVLGRHARLERAFHAHLIGFRLVLQQALRRQHVLHFAGADAERQRAESAVRGRVAIAANHGHAGLRQALLGTDDVHDALLVAVQADSSGCRTRVQFGFKLRDLRGRDLVDDRQRRAAWSACCGP